MKTIIINIVLVTGVILSFILGEILPIVLPRLSRHFNRKPFNCRPCFTFWLHGLGMGIVALIAKSWIIIVSGIVTAFITYLIVWYIEYQKVIK